MLHKLHRSCSSRPGGIRLCVLIGIAAAVPVMALAQNFPNRPVTLVVPYGPGASTDIETRMYAQKLTDSFGQPFVTDYKPGAGSTLGAAYVAKSAPDGHTLLSVGAAFSTSAALYTNLPYDPIKGFTPVSLMSQRISIIVTHPKAEFRSISEYLAYARAHPGKINVATAGAGGTGHLNSAVFHNMANLKVAYVHYKAAATSMTDLMAGRVDIIFTAATSGMPHVKTGKLRLLAVGNIERSPQMPDIPTAAEQGVPGYDFSSIFGFVGPAAIPPAILDRLSGEMAKVVKLPDVARRLEADGGVGVGSTPARFRELLIADLARYRKAVQESNINLEE